jgi:hypothetical protein
MRAICRKRDLLVRMISECRVLVEVLLFSSRPYVNFPVVPRM